MSTNFVLGGGKWVPVCLILRQYVLQDCHQGLFDAFNFSNSGLSRSYTYFLIAQKAVGDSSGNQDLFSEIFCLSRNISCILICKIWDLSLIISKVTSSVAFLKIQWSIFIWLFCIYINSVWLSWAHYIVGWMEISK